MALVLGLTSFGGPIAHIGYFHREYVLRRRWLGEHAFAELTALCQVLPGPSSSQLGVAIGLRRAGWGGALAAWLGFTLPSALALTAFALLAAQLDLAGAGWVAGLKLAAVAVVAAAVLSMWRSLVTDTPRRVIALTTAAVLIVSQMVLLQPALIAVGAVVGWLALRSDGALDRDLDAAPLRVSRRAGLLALTLCITLLAGLPLAARMSGNELLAVMDAFYRSGALVFGGGHVVLPLLHETVVVPGWISQETFLAGYGAAQAVPGPLFTFAAYLGASLGVAPSGVGGAALALGAIFLPGMLLLVAVLPFWDRLNRSARFRGALAGTNAVVTGLLIAALYDPIWTSAVHEPVHVLLVAVALLALVVGSVAPWIIVAALAGAGELLVRLG